MPFISVSDEITNKSFTIIENKFISKYLPMLDPVAIKVYLYSLYLFQSGFSACTLEDLAQKLNLSEDDAKSYFQYLEEFELVTVISLSPFEIKILDAENISGTPKKFKPEKYADFTKAVQSIIKGRMISTNEFREYFVLLEEYGFEQNALIMIIAYCVNLKGDNIRLQYIKKVAKSFAEDGITSAKKVDEKLSAYTYSTTALLAIFKAAGINRQPDIEDDKLYKKWTSELGFDDNAIITCAKKFKIKTTEKLDATLEELYKNKKFDVKEIEDYCDGKASIYSATLEIAKSLGVYMQNPAPYVENYVNVWCDWGFGVNSLKSIAEYCFKNGKKSFEDMNDFLRTLYDEGAVSDGSVEEYIEKLRLQDAFIKKILNACGLTRKVIEWDRTSLKKWRSWNFTDEMILEAATLSAGKANPTSYLSSILSSWKTEGKFSLDAVRQISAPSSAAHSLKTDVEKHFYDLRHFAEDKAEKALNAALADSEYGNIKRQLNELAISLAFAEIRDASKAENISKQIEKLEADGDKRLKELCIDKSDFTPKYSCKKCNDTGYTSDGSPCECMKKFISTL